MLTPCRSLCNIKDDVCQGCGRTSEHIRNWRSYDGNTREKICAEIADWVTPREFGAWQ